MRLLFALDFEYCSLIEYNRLKIVKIIGDPERVDCGKNKGEVLAGADLSNGPSSDSRLQKRSLHLFCYP